LEKAHEAGYVAAFSIDGKPARSSERLLALPRFLMNNAQQGRLFEQMVAVPHLSNTTVQR
jgi:hypothetical protein